MSFPLNYEDNYIIICGHVFPNKDDSSVKIYSLQNIGFLYNVEFARKNQIYQLLSWDNRIDGKNYIILIGDKSNLVYNIFTYQLYAQLKSELGNNNIKGIIYTNQSNDYLCACSENEFIDIWDLYNKQYYKTIQLRINFDVSNILNWNDKYIIVIDYWQDKFLVVDLDLGREVSVIPINHKEGITSIKKIYLPLFGESLLTSGKDECIKLWTVRTLSFTDKLIKIYKKK